MAFGIGAVAKHIGLLYDAVIGECKAEVHFQTLFLSYGADHTCCGISIGILSASFLGFCWRPT